MAENGDEKKRIYPCTCGAERSVGGEGMCVCCGCCGWHGSCKNDRPRHLFSGRLKDDTPVEPDWDDTKRKEEIIKWFMERMENVPDESYMDVKIALSYEKDGVFYDV